MNTHYWLAGSGTRVGTDSRFVGCTVDRAGSPNGVEQSQAEWRKSFVQKLQPFQGSFKSSPEGKYVCSLQRIPGRKGCSNER